MQEAIANGVGKSHKNVVSAGNVWEAPLGVKKVVGYGAAQTGNACASAVVFDYYLWRSVFSCGHFFSFTGTFAVQPGCIEPLNCSFLVTSNLLYGWWQAQMKGL
jgi:hypothetical protein